MGHPAIQSPIRHPLIPHPSIHSPTLPPPSPGPSPAPPLPSPPLSDTTSHAPGPEICMCDHEHEIIVSALMGAAGQEVGVR